MSTFYLLRHGAKEPIPGDPPLSAQGLKQATKTAIHMKKFKFDSIYASPFTRTKQTAAIVAEFHNLPVQIDSRLVERMNWGDKPNQTFENFMQEWAKTDASRTYEPSNGKSSYKSGESIRNFITELHSQNPKQSTLIVTHGGTIGDLLRNVFVETDLPIIADPELNTKYLEIAESSLTIIKFENGNFRRKLVGSTTHLS